MVPVGWLLSKEIFKTWQWVVALGPGDGGLAVSLRQKLAGGHRQRHHTRQPRGLHTWLFLYSGLGRSRLGRGPVVRSGLRQKSAGVAVRWGGLAAGVRLSSV